MWSSAILLAAQACLLNTVLAAPQPLEARKPSDETCWTRYGKSQQNKPYTSYKTTYTPCVSTVLKTESTTTTPPVVTTSTVLTETLIQTESTTNISTSISTIYSTTVFTSTTVTDTIITQTSVTTPTTTVGRAAFTGIQDSLPGAAYGGSGGTIPQRKKRGLKRDGTCKAKYSGKQDPEYNHAASSSAADAGYASKNYGEYAQSSAPASASKVVYTGKPFQSYGRPTSSASYSKASAAPYAPGKNDSTPFGDMPYFQGLDCYVPAPSPKCDISSSTTTVTYTASAVTSVLSITTTSTSTFVSSASSTVTSSVTSSSVSTTVMTLTNTLTTTTVSEAPTATAYAACAPRNFADTVNGLAITGGGDGYDGVQSFTVNSAYECCVLVQTTVQNPALWVYVNGAGVCQVGTQSTAGGNAVCNQNANPASVFASGDSPVYTWGNGLCGEITSVVT